MDLCAHFGQPILKFGAETTEIKALTFAKIRCLGHFLRLFVGYFDPQNTPKIPIFWNVRGSISALSEPNVKNFCHKMCTKVIIFICRSLKIDLANIFGVIHDLWILSKPALLTSP